MDEPDDNTLLEMRDISKGFPGVQALDGVDFTLHAGEIHALMGENGAGKSTLIKVLTGVYPRDTGEIRLGGTPVHPRSTKHAESLGISTVYQEINLIPHLSVAENICLGRQRTILGTILWGAIKQHARQAMGRLGIDIDVTREVSSYSIAIQQMVAIARALDTNARLLVLDEPTSSLDEHEVAELFGVIRNLRDEGLGIIFITHFLDQTYEIADRITVLRNGRFVGEYLTADLPRIELIARMIGKDTEDVAAMEVRSDAPPPLPAADVLVSVDRLARRGSVGAIDMTISRGEVVGLAGLLGSGRTEVARLLFGIDKPDAGQIRVDGQPVSIHSPHQAIALGFAFTPEDRRDAGIIPNLSVRENIVLALQASRGAWRTIGRRAQQELAEKFIEALNIRTPGPEQQVKNLSGGNQQKVLLARWLATEPRLLILDEPTRGIDVGAKAEIEKLIDSLRRQGMAILFISSELEEVVRDSQRVVVLRDREQIGQLSGKQITEPAIMHMIAKHQETGDDVGSTAI
ncbi:MAG: sugar ABC transporter ATP-binding protein [Phycisphaerae bacterium]|jgi:simple sugar transport system ATP-binding protein|nr:sugar ABC transporter ATP-binding protein [Phycisphaerae bacterium]